MLPLSVFASRQFSAANLVTFAVYAPGLSGDDLEDPQALADGFATAMIAVVAVAVAGAASHGR